MTRPLTEALLGAARPELVPPLESRPDLEERLQSIVAAGGQAWPELEVPALGYVAHLGARLRDAASVEITPGHVDLYLAFACLQGLAAAVTEVEARAHAQATRAARRLHLTADECQELTQEMSVAVLVGEHGGPGIAGYAGQGPLDAWLSAIALRIAIRRRQSARRESPDGTAEATAQGWDLGGLNIERIGVCYGVHRATVARWIGDARERLLGDTRARLAGNLQLKASEVDSLVGLLRSQVEVSLLKYLATSDG